MARGALNGEAEGNRPMNFIEEFRFTIRPAHA
jgi:hypothetical protein